MTVLATLTLPAVKRSPGYVRKFLRDTLGEDHPILYSLQLCATELFTNGLQHSRSRFFGGYITVVLASAEDSVRVSVIDGGCEGLGPRVRADTDGESGRGMIVVRELSDDWGTDVVDGTTTVWFRMSF